MVKSQLGPSKAAEAVGAILTESVISLADAQSLLEKQLGSRPSRATVCRWIHSGSLQAIKLGRQLFTSQEAIHRFIVDRTATIISK